MTRGEHTAAQGVRAARALALLGSRPGETLRQDTDRVNIRTPWPGSPAN